MSTHGSPRRGLLTGLLALTVFGSGAVALAAHSSAPTQPVTASAAAAPFQDGAGRFGDGDRTISFDGDGRGGPDGRGR